MTLAASMNSRPTLHLLTGPTAVGKTEWALAWAERFGAEIVSCDSLLFYRGLDLGTAKPTRAELARVPHHLIDTVEVTERYDVERYVREARAAIGGILARGRRVLVAGGSGFYLKSFVAAVTDTVAVPAELRRAIEERFDREGLAPLLAELRSLNPEGLGDLDVQNPRRVLRGLERCRASGRTLRALRDEFERLPSPFSEYQVRLVRLERDPAELSRRVASRVDAMLATGLVDEVRGMLAHGLAQNPSAVSAIGYRETIDHLEGRLPWSELAAAITRNTQALVKKQRTWFRTQLPEHAVIDAAGAVAPERLFA